MPAHRTEHRGITQKKKNDVLKNLKTLMPTNRLAFYENLHVNNNSVDLATEREPRAESV